MHASFRAGAWAGAFLIAATGLAACTSASPAPASAQRSSPAQASDSAPGSVPASRSPQASPTAAGKGAFGAGVSTDVHACREGTCRVRVTAPVTIPVDESRFGFPSVRITVTGSEVGAAASPPGGSLDDSSTVPGNLALNNLHISVQALSGTNVILALSRT